LLGLVVILAATLAAAAPAGAANTCALLTKAEASKFLGTPVALVEPKNRAGTDECRYSNASKTQNVLITVDTGGDVPQQMAMLGMSHAPAVSGTGAKAYYLSGTLFAQKGKALVTVAIYKSADSLQKMDPGLPALARLVLGRL
jgi:hypothetical protein